MVRSLTLSSLTLLAVACGGHVALGGPTGGDGGGGSSGSSGGNGVPDTGTIYPVPDPPPGTLARANKVDLLLVVDNSASMGDKQELLRLAVPDLVRRLVAPNCVDANGAPLGVSSGGVCSQGKLEFAPVADLHVGAISTSLGGRGGDICDGTDPVGEGATRHDDDKAHLLNRGSLPGDPLERAVPDVSASNVLAFPSATGGDVTRFVGDVTQLIAGVHEYGCGIEAQLESLYRFLIQPDPYNAIGVDPNDSRRRTLDGVDETLLKQRHDFLRPDSLVAVVLLTDEDDSAPDPRGVGGQAWAYSMKRFPGSAGGGAARGTAACDVTSTVDTADCTSCGFAGHAQDANCQKPGDTDTGIGQPQLGYYKAAEDTLNTRYVRVRERYGVDPQFPISRYFLGLSSSKVPDRAGEQYDGVGVDGKANNTYNARAGCTNPLFAASLPTAATDELCNLPVGPRSANLVVFATITGVPDELLAPQLDAAAWTKIVGKDPRTYDYTGIDPHMLQSQSPRAGLPTPAASDTADPMNGREWDTGSLDLQYACTFPLTTPKDCKEPAFAGACDCASGTPPLPPLCDATTRTMQVRAKAYPGIRQLELARELGGRAVVASICPKDANPNSPTYGYRAAIQALGNRMAASLAPAQ
jgi:hypothetical protein